MNWSLTFKNPPSSENNNQSALEKQDYIVLKFVWSSWEVNAQVLSTKALFLTYSTAEYGSCVAEQGICTIIIVALLATPFPLILCVVRAALHSGKKSKPRTI